MNNKGWKYYNHAIVPDIYPHELVDLKPLQNNSIWKIRGGDCPKTKLGSYP